MYNWPSSLSSSKEIEKKDTPGQNPFDINIRTIIADACVNISKLSMTEAAEDLRLNSIHENQKTQKLMLQVISQKFNMSVKKVCSMQLQALLHCNRMIYFYLVFYYNTKDAY